LHWARAKRVALAGLTMAARSYVLTIARVAKLLGEPEELLRVIAMTWSRKTAASPSWASVTYPPLAQPE
jgi:hypothetical protein